MAYLYARNNKTHRKIKIDIEDKHKYYNHLQSPALNVYKENSNDSMGPGYHPIPNNFVSINLSDKVAIEQGSAEDERIGNKVFMKYFNITYGIHLYGASLITNFPHGTITNLNFKFRVMVVKFDQAMSTTDLSNWFNDTYTYFNLINVSGGNQVPLVSNQWDRLRESTKWTGSFKIMYDKKIALTNTKSTRLKSVNIPICQNVNFSYNNSDGRSYMTDENLQNIYFFIITPSCVRYDMDAISQDGIDRSSTGTSTIGYANFCMKYEYYDI